MKKILFFMLMSISVKTLATPQIAEILDIGDVKFEINELPLESHPKFEALKIGAGSCSASWRGYQGKWSIRDDKLYLDYVLQDPCSKDPKHLYGAELLDTNGDYIAVANWYTGNITFRISKIEISGKYEAVVYKVEKGKIISRNVEQVSAW